LVIAPRGPEEALAGVDESDLDGSARAERREGRSGDSLGHRAPDAMREQIGAVLRPVQTVHVLVIGLEHDVLARDDMVGGECQGYPTGGSVTCEGRDHEMRVGSMISPTRSSIAFRLRHDSSAASSAASIMLRCMPLEK
jgi:hypothetical protein